MYLYGCNMNAVVRLFIEQAEESQDTLGETFFRIEGEDDEQVLLDLLFCYTLAETSYALG